MKLTPEQSIALECIEIHTIKCKGVNMKFVCYDEDNLCTLGFDKRDKYLEVEEGDYHLMIYACEEQGFVPDLKKMSVNYLRRVAKHFVGVDHKLNKHELILSLNENLLIVLKQFSKREPDFSKLIVTT